MSVQSISSSQARTDPLSVGATRRSIGDDCETASSSSSTSSVSGALQAFLGALFQAPGSL